MNKRVLVLIAAFICLVGGCAMAPEYRQPAPPVSQKWPEGDAYRQPDDPPDVPAVQELTRQAFFKNESLLKLIDLALENNRDLRLAVLNVERARNLYGIQRAERFPAVHATGGGAREKRSSELISPGEARTVEQYTAGLGIAAWEIDFFGRIRHLEDQALEEFLATDAARQSVKISLVAEVARAYLTLAADRENLNLARSTLASQKKAHELIKRQYEVGIATELDLHRAQIPVETTRRDVARFTQSMALTQNGITLLAGPTVPQDLLPQDLESVHMLRDVLPDLPSEALLVRPDVMAAEHRLKSAYAYIGAARAAFFPRISLTTGIGTASDALSGLFSSGTGTWTFVPQMSLPILDTRVQAAYRVSKAQRDIAVTQYEKTIQTAFREVADALAVQGMIRQQISAQKALTDAVEKTYLLAEKRYAKGIDSYLEVLDAQRSLYAQQQALNTLVLQKLVNQVRLYAALGGGND
ncbi:MAG: efflux transporter outer membrane subunit [Desulfotignum sp.]|nr:efflux transporter outer membrane subunit [Desulfotignum sp.]